ncbi:MAG TPA: hypothetical protein VF158_09245 [Longimicrobiales bacterium]
MTERSTRAEADAPHTGPVHRGEPGARAAPAPGAGGMAYEPPRLERLGAWRALTLQQSVPIFP